MTACRRFTRRRFAQPSAPFELRDFEESAFTEMHVDAFAILIYLLVVGFPSLIPFWQSIERATEQTGERLVSREFLLTGKSRSSLDLYLRDRHKTEG